MFVRIIYEKMYSSFTFECHLIDIPLFWDKLLKFLFISANSAFINQNKGHSYYFVCFFKILSRMFVKPWLACSITFIDAKWNSLAISWDFCLVCRWLVYDHNIISWILSSVQAWCEGYLINNANTLSLLFSTHLHIDDFEDFFLHIMKLFLLKAFSDHITNNSSIV